MNARRLLRMWLLPLFALTVFAGGIVQAQDAGIKLSVVKVEASGSVRLQWTPPTSTTIKITKYAIYRIAGTDTVHIGDTTGTAWTDLPPLSLNRMTYKYFVAGQPATGKAIVSNTVTVENLSIPLIGSFRLDAKVDEANALVQLTWTKPPVDAVIMYYLYRAAGAAALVPSQYQLIDSTTALTLTDKPTPGPTVAPGMIGGMGDSQMASLYTYVVKAKTALGTLQSTSAAVYFTVPVKSDTVTFVTTPVTTAQINVAYTAKVLATSSDPTAKITYSLDRKADGMTIDLSSTTPILKWTPKTSGFYSVIVIAKSDKGGSARQQYTISVASGNGIVQGTVTDTTGTKPLAKVIIQILKRDINPLSCFTYSTTTDANGAFRFTKLDPGTYILQAIPTSGDYQGQWWNGKKNADEASPLIVADSTAAVPSVLANFKLRSRIIGVPQITVSGTVTDTLGLPVNVKESHVIFVRSDFALNSSTSSADVTIDNFKKFFDYDKATDFRIEGTSTYAYKVSVDSLGKYSLKIPQGSYIALARAPGYASEFYKEQTDLLSANIMKLTADSSNINFTLAVLPPVVLGSISGSVLDTVKDIGVRARVIAYRDGWTTADGFKVAKNYFTDTDSLGNYKFTDLLPGSYFIMAVPLGGYAPAYYTADTSSLNWKKGTKIIISGNSVSGIDIIVKQLSATKGGFTWIAGTVKGRMNGKLGGVSGAIITATDASGQPAGYGISDVDGNYTIIGVAPDSYTVTVDKSGYSSAVSAMANPSYNMMATGSASNTVGVVVPSFTLDAVTSIEAQASSVVPTEFTVEQNYPNPFNPSTKIQFSLPAAQHVTVSVYDLLGREVASLVNGQMTAGTYTVEWNASAMTTGIYFYRVNVGTSSVVKKMMLLK